MALVGNLDIMLFTSLRSETIRMPSYPGARLVTIAFQAPFFLGTLPGAEKATSFIRPSRGNLKILQPVPNLCIFSF